jgi:hypothetical protein
MSAFGTKRTFVGDIACQPRFMSHSVIGSWPLPSDTVDVAAGNSNVGQFTVAQAGKLLDHALISLPMLNEAKDR